MAVIPLRERVAASPTDRVAAEVRAMMGRYGVTQNQLAEVLGVTQPSISKRLHGQTPFDVNELGQLADYFDVSMSELLGEGKPLSGGPDGGIEQGRRRPSGLPRLDSNQQPFGYATQVAA